VTGEKTKERVYHYAFAKLEMWLCACKPESEGGFPGFRDENGNIFISYSSFERMLPKNIRQMTETHKAMCGCELCIGKRNIHKSLIEWQVAQLKQF
jgi:hypothetical protein